MIESQNGEPLFIFLPVEWFVSEGVAGVTHFDDAKLSLYIVASTLHYEVNDTIGKVVFDTIFTKLLVVVTCHFTDEE